MEIPLQVPLGEQAHLKELFAMLEKDHMEEQIQSVQEFLQYFGDMNKYFEDLQSELVYLREQLDQLNDKTLKAKLDKFADTVKGRVDTARIWLSATKNEMSNGIKTVVEETKYLGGQGVYKAIDRTKITKALNAINEHLGKSISSLEESQSKIEEAHMEFHEAKAHKNRAKSVLYGKTEAKSKSADKGILVSINEILEYCKKILGSMKGRTASVLKSLDGLSQKAISAREERAAAIPAVEEKKEAESVNRGKAR